MLQILRTIKGVLPDPACDWRAAGSMMIRHLVLRVCVATTVYADTLRDRNALVNVLW